MKRTPPGARRAAGRRAWALLLFFSSPSLAAAPCTPAGDAPDAAIGAIAEVVEALPRGFRSAHDGTQPSGVALAAGDTRWLDALELEKATLVLANFSTIADVLNRTGGLLDVEAGIHGGANLEFVTVNGSTFAFTHFDGTFGLRGAVARELSGNRLLRFTVDLSHESTHVGDSALNAGVRSHQDSAEWVGGEIALQSPGRTVETELYVSGARFFHSMASHPLHSKGSAGAVVSVLDRRVSASGQVDWLRAGESSAPVVAGETGGLHLGGMAKLVIDPTASGRGGGVTLAYETGTDPFGQNLGQGGVNRLLLGVQLRDFNAGARSSGDPSGKHR